MSRRRFLGGLGSAALAVAFLAACSEDGEDGTVTATSATEGTATAEATDTSTGTATSAPSEAAAFPVTISHKFGEVTVESEPARVLTVGFSEQDPVLALGVVPVAVREWFGEQPYAAWPWATDALGSGTPEVLTLTYGELEFEQIAALNPDLIIATHSGITDVEYETLAQIAPTLAQSGDYPDFGMPWQEQTRSIGIALGRADLAKTRIAEVETAIEATAAAHPEFRDATVAWVSPADGEGQFWATGPTTPPLRFLGQLGFRMDDALAAAIGDGSSLQISSEQLDLIDADVLIVQTVTAEGRAAIESHPIVQGMRAVTEGRAIFFEATTVPAYAALSFSTVLSLPFALETLVPFLTAAVDGDPATTLDPNA